MSAAKKAGVSSSLWGIASGSVETPKKSGRIIKLKPEPEKPKTAEKKLSGWRKKAQDQKHKLFSSATEVVPVVRGAPVKPTKPVLHMKCRNTGMKFVDGRKYRCECPWGDKPKVKFTPGEYATDAEIMARDGYEP